MKATSKLEVRERNSAPIGKRMWVSKRERAEVLKELEVAEKEREISS